MKAAAEAAADPTVERDLERLGGYLAGHGEPFTAIELVGFTASHDVVYRTAICDPDELGGRGAWCGVQVCSATGATLDASTCDTLVDETVGDSAPLDRARVTAAIRDAEATRAPATRGDREASPAVTLATHDGGLTATAPSWFGASAWTLSPAVFDRDTGEPLGIASAAITSVRSDGGCLAFAGTALRRARYESVVGSIRFAFAARRCR